MTEDELRAIEARHQDDQQSVVKISCESCVRLVAEVRRLTRERDDAVRGDATYAATVANDTIAAECDAALAKLAEESKLRATAQADCDALRTRLEYAETARGELRGRVQQLERDVEQHVAASSDNFRAAKVTFAEIETSLAASQAQVVELRGALEGVLKTSTVIIVKVATQEHLAARAAGVAALAAPSDDAALREFGLRVVSCARALDGPVLADETIVDAVLRGER